MDRTNQGHHMQRCLFSTEAWGILLLGIALVTVLSGCGMRLKSPEDLDKPTTVTKGKTVPTIQAPAMQKEDASSDQTEPVTTTVQESVGEKYKLPMTSAAKPELNSAFMLNGFTYELESVHEVDGRQGIAWSEDGYFVSGSTSLSHYDENWKVVSANDKPFQGFQQEVNHIGDIDVYGGELYASVEYFMDGKASAIQVAIYDAKTLSMKRSYPVDSASGQTEVSGIAVDPDSESIWLCSWAADLSGHYLYRYDLETGSYLGKIHLQAPPEQFQGVAYHQGWLYLTADDGDADAGETDHVWRTRVDVSKTSWPCVMERSLDDVTLVGEVEGISFDSTDKQMLVSYNRGAHIVAGMAKGFYEGYDKEVHEVFCYDMKRCAHPIDYTLDEMWLETGGDTTSEVDTFLVLPCVNLKATSSNNEDVFDLRSVERFTKTLAMEKGIVSGVTNVFAPLYRQQTMGVYLTSDGTISQSIVRANDDSTYAKLAYQDVKDAFEEYLKNRGKSRPFILFGYSQGADMVLRLVAEYGGREDIRNRLVCAYAIGTPIDTAFVRTHPAVKMAERADDTGVVVSYNAVSESNALDGPKELSINPLNWKTDATKATADLNLGCVITDTDGSVSYERASFCGATLDPKSGKLICDAIADPGVLKIESTLFKDGDLHLYDLSLFYRNLEANVRARIESFNKQGT